MATTHSSSGNTGTTRGEMRQNMEHPHWNLTVITFCTIALLLSGLMMVTSASSVFSYQHYGSSYALAIRQLGFGAVGGYLAWRVSYFSVVQVRRLVAPLLLLSGTALVLVLVIGSSVNGQKNWINLWGPLRLQPSEFAKLAVVLFGAHVMARNYHRLDNWVVLLFPVSLVFLAILFLIMAEGDLGTAMVITPIMAAPFYFVGAPRSWFVGLATFGVLGILGLSYAQPYRMRRFTSWLHQNSDQQGTNYQFTHGKYALGSGGILGQGLGASKEKWGTLPEAHTDFIYAVIGEETGLLGTIIVLALFIALITSGIRIAKNTHDNFVKLTSLGICTWLATQMIVNIGGVLGILPITGVPLPLVSYGGSSLIPTLIALGILMSFARQET